MVPSEAICMTVGAKGSDRKDEADFRTPPALLLLISLRPVPVPPPPSRSSHFAEEKRVRSPVESMSVKCGCRCERRSRDSVIQILSSTFIGPSFLNPSSTFLSLACLGSTNDVPVRKPLISCQGRGKRNITRVHRLFPSSSQQQTAPSNSRPVEKASSHSTPLT